MGAFFVYILKSAICLALFYLFYRLLLSKETFHRFNRVALLGLLVASCVVPLIEVGADASSGVSRQFLSLEEMLMMAEVGTVAEEVAIATWSWHEVLLLIYLLGIAFFLVRNVWSLGRMLALMGSCKRRKLADGVLLFTHEKEMSPFSWMRCIVLSEKDYSENGAPILTHERAHIANRHSWDLLLADLCVFFQWFNPAAWLLKQELQNIHEFEADEWVLNQGIDAKTYQLLLIKKAVGTRLYSMANNLNHSNLKKRITMMIKKKSNPWARLKYLYVLPLAAVAVAAFARPEISNELDEISSAKVSNLASIMKANSEKSIETPQNDAVAPAPQDSVVFEVVEEMPEFPGGFKAMMQFIISNVKYPAVSQENGTQGRVIAQFTVGKDGSISDAKVLRSVDPYLDKEALRVINAMPKWKPGRQRGQAVAVHFTVPIDFRLPSDELEDRPVISAITLKVDGAVPMGTVNDVKEYLRKGNRPKINYELGDTLTEGKGLIFRGDAQSTLVVVDGEVKGYGTEHLNTINPTDISAIWILKPEKAIAAYGEKAKDGAIVVVTKEGEKAMAGKVAFYPAITEEPNVEEVKVIGSGEYSSSIEVLGIITETVSSALFVVDGEEKGYGQEVLGKLNPQDIQTITVLKDKSAIEQFGEKAKNGAILITTKKASK